MRTRQFREGVAAYVEGIEDGAWIIKGDAGTTKLAVPHNNGGLFIAAPVQQTRSGVPMFDFAPSTAVATSTSQQVLQISEDTIAATYPAKALQYVDSGGGGA